MSGTETEGLRRRPGKSDRAAAASAAAHGAAEDEAAAAAAAEFDASPHPPRQGYAPATEEKETEEEARQKRLAAMRAPYTQQSPHCPTCPVFGRLPPATQNPNQEQILGDAAYREAVLLDRAARQKELHRLWNEQRIALGLDESVGPVEQVMGQSGDNAAINAEELQNVIIEAVGQMHRETRGRVDQAADGVKTTIASGLEKTREEMKEATRNIRDDIRKAKTELVRECSGLNEVRKILQCLLIMLGQFLRVWWTANKTIYYAFRILTFFLQSGVGWVPWAGPLLKGLISLAMSILFIMIYANIITYISLGFINGNFVTGKLIGWGIQGGLWCWSKIQILLGQFSTQGHEIGGHAGLNVTRINQQVQQWGSQLQVYKTVAEGAQAVSTTAARAGQAVATGARAVAQGAQTTVGTLANATRAVGEWIGFGGRTRKKRRGKKHTKTRRKNKKRNKKKSKKRKKSRRRKKTRRRRRRAKHRGGALALEPMVGVDLANRIEPLIKAKTTPKTQIVSKKNRQQLLPLLKFLEFQAELIDKLFLKEMTLKRNDGEEVTVAGGVIGAITWIIEEAMEENKKKVNVEKIDKATVKMVKEILKKTWGSEAPKAQVMTNEILKKTWGSEAPKAQVMSSG